MDLHINDKLEFPDMVRIYLSKTNRNCDRSSEFIVDFKDGNVIDYAELIDRRVGYGLKLFKTDLKKLKKFGLDNLEKWVMV